MSIFIFVFVEVQLLIDSCIICWVFFLLYSEPPGQQEASPNASRGGGSLVNGNNNASLNPKNGPRVGGSAYPPPVGRFAGDPTTGSNWNSRSQSLQSRNNGAGASGTADGISNYGGGALNRRSNTPGRPPLAGACGLVNVGNTCYLNSAVQCLSHTPLVRAYLLSDMWAAEVNKYNPLGTQVMSRARAPLYYVAVWYGMVWYGLARYVMYGEVWYGVAWCMERYDIWVCTLVWCGMVGRVRLVRRFLYTGCGSLSHGLHCCWATASILIPGIHFNAHSYSYCCAGQAGGRLRVPAEISLVTGVPVHLPEQV